MFSIDIYSEERKPLIEGDQLDVISDVLICPHFPINHKNKVIMYFYKTGNPAYKPLAYVFMLFLILDECI